MALAAEAREAMRQAERRTRVVGWETAPPRTMQAAHPDFSGMVPAPGDEAGFLQARRSWRGTAS